MRQTLFHIPPEIAGQPLFGYGIALWIWLVFGALVIFVSWRKHRWGAETLGHFPVLVLVALAIIFVLPNVEDRVPGENGEVNLGLPIRGYGVLVLLAVVCGVALAVYRLGRVGISSDIVMNLAFAMFIFGIVGARLFYVIQYWERFQAENLRATLINTVSFVEGGLVVYGSLLGGIMGFAYYCWKKKLPPLPIADLIAPSLALGLAIGRIGCLMNGCCFGGLCDHAWAIAFPPDSPAYDHQKGQGLYHGFRLTETPQGVMVAELVSEEIIGDAQIAVGEIVDSINGKPISSLAQANLELMMSHEEITLGIGSRTVLLAPRKLPAKSLPVHPTQIYSALNGLLICFVGLTLYPYIKRDGQVIAVVLTLYAITRFMLEIIRQDEGSFLATGLTISQNVSVLMGIGLVGLWIYIFAKPGRRMRNTE